MTSAGRHFRPNTCALRNSSSSRPTCMTNVSPLAELLATSTWRQIKGTRRTIMLRKGKDSVAKLGRTCLTTWSKITICASPSYSKH